MCFHPIQRVFPPSVHDRLIGLASNRVLQLPCGKCADCLRKRQNDLMTRCYREAQKFGVATFVTLTYAPSAIPVAKSLWIVDDETGAMRLWDKPELVTDGVDLIRGRIDRYSRACSGAPVLEDDVLGLSEAAHTFGEALHQNFFIRYTPTLYYEDVKLALKRFRKNNSTLPEFTYVAVGEYGSHNTQRPHYHLIFFGLNAYWCNKFADEWKRYLDNSFTVVKQIEFVGKNGDGLARVSRYVGKYCTKQVTDAYFKGFQCTLPNRIRCSKGLGTWLPSSLERYFLAKDVCEYDVDDPYGTIPEHLREVVVKSICDRLHFTIDGFNYAIPHSLKRRLFHYQRVDSKSYVRPKGFTGKNVYIEEKAHYSPLWYMVTAELQRRALENADAEFRQLVSDFTGTDIRPMVDKLNNHKKVHDEAREASMYNSLLKFYQQQTKI